MTGNDDVSPLPRLPHRMLELRSYEHEHHHEERTHQGMERLESIRESVNEHNREASTANNISLSRDLSMASLSSLSCSSVSSPDEQEL
jgi:hypothetical protein